ncbi:hypothetical protein TcBrA4_0115900 [Trypanosoma cruzi]|nr:hypothetical protein TcBrA4_0115900 [Trypanosoma cruzi]
MAAMMTVVTVRRRVGPCALLLLLLLVRVYVTAAGSAGDVSGDADAVVVPCAPGDGSLSYRVRVCAWAWKKRSAAGAGAQYENYTFSGFDVRMDGRNGELGAVCHVANTVHTCSNCAAGCARKEEGATVAFTMNVTTHKYAGPYELWRRQFPPMEPSIRLHGAAMLTGRASVSCRHPVKKGTTQNLVGQLRRKLMLSRHVSTRIGDSLRRLTHTTPSIRVPHPTRRPTRPRRGLSSPFFGTQKWLRYHPKEGPRLSPSRKGILSMMR